MSSSAEDEVNPQMSQQISEATSMLESAEEIPTAEEPQPGPLGPTQLTQALRPGADRLDGVPRASSNQSGGR